MREDSRLRVAAALFALWAGAALLHASVLAAEEAMTFGHALGHAAGDQALLPLLAVIVWRLAGGLERRAWPVALGVHLVCGAVLVALWEGSSWLVLQVHTGNASAVYRHKGLWMALNTTMQYGVLTCGVLALRATRRLERQKRREAELALHTREAELRALRAQVRPHFLFNVLNSIYALVGTRPAEAQEMIALLSDLLRRTLEAGDDALVPLSWELATTEAYLGIERIRLRERLRTQVDLDGADPGTLVPPLLLQPLVENAVKHGAAASVDGGRVSIEARRGHRTLDLTVRNDRPLADGTAAEREGGRGLALTRARLSAFYGEGFTMDVHPEDGAFTVTLRLPLEAVR
jgi:two-component system, LytTR family, sensor kinase